MMSSLSGPSAAPGASMTSWPEPVSGVGASGFFAVSAALVSGVDAVFVSVVDFVSSVDGFGPFSATVDSAVLPLSAVDAPLSAVEDSAVDSVVPGAYCFGVCPL